MMGVDLVQESHSTDNDTDWRTEWTGETFLSHETSNSCGAVESEEVIKGHLLKVIAVCENVKTVFINIYARAVGVDRAVFLDVLNEVIEKCNDEECVLSL